MSFTTRVRDTPEDGTTVTSVVRVPRHPRPEQPRFVPGRINTQNLVKAQDEWIGLGATIGTYYRFDPTNVLPTSPITYGINFLLNPYLYFGTNPASRNTYKIKFLNVHLRARLNCDINATDPSLRFVLIYDRFPNRTPATLTTGNVIIIPKFQDVFGTTSAVIPTTATHIHAPQLIDSQFRFQFVWQRRYALHTTKVPEINIDEFIDLSSFTSTYACITGPIWAGDTAYQPKFGMFYWAVLQETPTPNTSVASNTGVFLSNAAIRWSFIDIGLPA